MERIRRGLVACAAAAALFALAAPALAGDAAKGKRVYNKCKACHVLDKEKNKVGPHLVGVFGRVAGSVEGFRYSKAMAESGIVWDDATLDAYLTKPRAFLKGGRMAFAGLKKEKDRADVIAYMKAAQPE